ncbi:hypothetical protein [Prochlorococcus marinus]|nr:hypothetical protein [Prochlorococcus marinus]
MRRVITSAKELRDGVFTEEEIPPQNLKEMNSKTHLQQDIQPERHPLEKGRGALGQKRLIERSFEHAQSPKSFETEIGLNRLNPEVMDPNSEENSEPTIKESAIGLNHESNTDRPKLPTMTPLGHNAPNGPIEDDNTEPVDHLGFDLESLNVNHLIDPSNFINMDEFLGDIQDIQDMAKEIVAGGTQSGWFDDFVEGWDRFWDDDNRLGTEDEDDLTGCGDDLDGDGTPNWRDWDYHFGDDEDSDGDGVNNNRDKDNNDPDIQIMAGQGKGGNLPPWVNAMNIADAIEINKHHESSLLEPIASPLGQTLLSEDLFMIHKIQANDFSQPMPNETITPILDI